ncbi:MAG TPA: methylenetetrahydromethanopterin dehydrogenase [Methylophilus sp.]|nr:methylenetetrahydromethanopterin dehydrogenase [Methylophilus sp.]HQQ33649.1 methylenetetrahydromethanopterin dehydrogenase [Methylophilus sp.]
MEKVSILHLFTAAKNASPFDVNMAFDAGFDKIMPYTNVLPNEAVPLTQDAMFSRSPSGVKREAIFIGGRDIDVAMDMLKAAKNCMFPPFQMSVMADPSGAFTTAAAMVAKVSTGLAKQGESLKGASVAIFGASGPVGSCAAVIAAKEGAHVTLAAHRGLDEMVQHAENLFKRYGTMLGVVDASTGAAKSALASSTQVALSCGPAGVQVLSRAQLEASPSLQMVADVNAVAPLGIEGVGVNDDGILITGTNIIGIGALAIGNVKYATQHELLKSMLDSEHAIYLDFLSAYEKAKTLAV